MKLQILLLCLVAGCCYALDECKDISKLSKEEIEEAFQNALRSIKADQDELKSDVEDVDDEEREKRFKEAADRIKKQNTEDSSFTQGLNKFAALSDSEKDAMKGTILTDEDKEVIRRKKDEHAAEMRKMKRDGKYLRQIPESVDLCHYTGTVENQASCGSCWAFSGSHVLTGRVRARDGGATGKTINLSEQQNVDCAKAYAGWSSKDGCRGGGPSAVWRYVGLYGAHTEAQYPYTAAYDASKDSQCADKSNKIDLHVDVSSQWSHYKCVSENTDDIKRAIMEGPVSIVMNVDPEEFGSYKSGVFSVQCNPKEPQGAYHAMLACGFGKDAATGKDYWIVKNSWGSNWGDNGYIKVEMGKDICGVESFGVCYPVLKSESADTSSLCYKDKECSSDANCNNIKGSCQSGKCNCYACAEGRLCTSDAECGGRTDSCSGGKCYCSTDCVDSRRCTVDAGCGDKLGACTPWQNSCNCTYDSTKCESRRFCKTDLHCGGMANACKDAECYTYSDGTKQCVKRCDCEVNVCKDGKICSTDADCGSKAGACQKTNWVYTYDPTKNVYMCSCS